MTDAQLVKFAAEFRAGRWFQAKLDSVPEEYRAAAECEISDDDGDATIRISYTRPMTDEEMAADERRRRAAAEQEAERERYILAALKAKYETKPPGAT